MFTHPATSVSLLHHNGKAFAVAIELRGVHALDVRETRLVLATQLNSGRVFKNVLAFGQVVDEEMTGRVFGRFVVRQTILETVP